MSTDESLLIKTGANFLLAMQKSYGTEKGLELWDSMRTAMGDDLAGSIFFGILSGTINGPVKVRLMPNKNYSPYFYKKIEGIKALRTVTGWGLKDSKDFIESMEFDNYRSFEPLDEADIFKFTEEMRQAGFEVT